MTLIQPIFIQASAWNLVLGALILCVSFHWDVCVCVVMGCIKRRGHRSSKYDYGSREGAFESCVWGEFYVSASTRRFPVKPSDAAKVTVIPASVFSVPARSSAFRLCVRFSAHRLRPPRWPRGQRGRPLPRRRVAVALHLQTLFSTRLQICSALLAQPRSWLAITASGVLLRNRSDAQWERKSSSSGAGCSEAAST